MLCLYTVVVDNKCGFEPKKGRGRMGKEGTGSWEKRRKGDRTKGEEGKTWKKRESAWNWKNGGKEGGEKQWKVRSNGKSEKRRRKKKRKNERGKSWNG